MKSLVAGLAGALITLLFAHGRSTPYNNYVLFADALLHGRLWIDWPGPYIDAVSFEGYRYIVNDPVPALLLLPVVALFGVHANQTLLACALAGVATGAAWSLCKRLGCDDDTTAWLTIFTLAGTDLLWCSMLGDVWFVAQTSCVAFLLLALVELAGARRGWVVMLLFALAAGSRFTVVVAAPVVLFWLAYGFAEPKRRLADLWSALATAVPFIVLWIAYNEARWHVPWDSGHTIFYHEDAGVGSATGSPFAFANIPMQLRSFFVQGPTWLVSLQPFAWAWPVVRPEMSGVALTWTSPALALALFARRPAVLALSAWIAALLVAGPSLLYYVNGYAQFGMRHALDFEPFLLVAMALAARNRLHPIWQVLIAWSVLTGLWGSWFWNTFYRTS